MPYFKKINTREFLLKFRLKGILFTMAVLKKFILVKIYKEEL